MTKKNIETTFAAAAFAEAGEHETAMRMMGFRPAYEKVRQFCDYIASNFAAAGFAEANCHDDAIRFAEPQGVCARQGDSLDTFLETVGLGQVRVCYGLAQI